jgi:metal-responsive CopG/Arc/MetJ family transcriptional regulator
MKTAISISDELFQNAERIAKQKKLSRSELFRQALLAYLDKHDEHKITESLNKIYGHQPENENIDPLLEKMQYASISSEDW